MGIKEEKLATTKRIKFTKEGKSGAITKYKSQTRRDGDYLYLHLKHSEDKKWSRWGLECQNNRIAKSLIGMKPTASKIYKLNCISSTIKL